jgi:hypothetical protein
VAYAKDDAQLLTMASMLLKFCGMMQEEMDTPVQSASEWDLVTILAMLEDMKAVLRSRS